MDEEKGPDVALTFQQLNVISNLLYFYEQHLWHFTTPSAKRTRQITEIQVLLVKMPLLATSKIGIFTPAEIGYIEKAVNTFIKQAKEKIPQSQSRDEILASCEALREYLVNTLL